MKKKLAMLLAVTMLATLFTGCGAGGKEDKGELNLYTWDGMFPQEILDGFSKLIFYSCRCSFRYNVRSTIRTYNSNIYFSNIFFSCNAIFK